RTRRIIFLSPLVSQILSTTRGRIFHDLCQKLIRLRPSDLCFRSKIRTESLTKSPHESRAHGVVMRIHTPVLNMFTDEIGNKPHNLARDAQALNGHTDHLHQFPALFLHASLEHWFERRIDLEQSFVEELRSQV